MIIRLYLILTIFLTWSICASAQPNRTVLTGVIMDSISHEKLPGVTLVIKGTTIGAVSDIYGNFVLNVPSSVTSDTLMVSYMGYDGTSLKFNKGKSNELNIKLNAVSYALDNVVVRASRHRYSRKNNPAIELVQKLIAKNAKHDPRALHDKFGYERYEKITVSLSNYDKDPKSKKLAFLAEHRDTNQITGTPSLPISIKERIIKTRVAGKDKSETIVAKRSEGVDDKLSQENIDAYTKVTLDEIDVFGNDVYFLMRNFVGPLSGISLSYYKYYLAPDTISFDGARCIQLSFSPYAIGSLGFSGKFYVTADSTLFIRGLELNFPNATNINFVYDMIVTQSFAQGDNGERLLTKDDIFFKFMLFSRNDKAGFDIRRINSYRDYVFDTVAIEPPPVIDTTNAEFWSRTRHIPISIQEQKIDSISTKFRNIPLYRFGEWFMTLLSEEYIHLGPKSKFDIGSVMYFLSSNALEGTRLLLGGVTTPYFSPRLFLEGYVAYGTTDKKIKWNTAVEYSFVNRKKSIREFPIHSLRAEFNYDVHKFGRMVGELSRDNIFSWIKRQADSSLTYMRAYQLIYTRESKTNFSYYATARHYTQSGSRIMSFGPDGILPNFSMSELELRLRYAPGEKLFQNQRRRKSYENNTPIYEFSHTSGFKGVLGGDYSHNLTQARYTKRFNLSPLGFFNTKIKAGVEWDAVPYMLLPHPHTNLTYVMRTGSFSLMNPLELMYDRYLQWDVEWHMGGFILSKIPLVKLLKLREVFSMKGVWATLTDKNNPLKNLRQLPLPMASSPIGSEPYMEIGFGLENILKFFRVDYVRRVSYTGKSGTNDWGILFYASAKF